jgi:parallel beta-helix repeat protein
MTPVAKRLLAVFFTICLLTSPALASPGVTNGADGTAPPSQQADSVSTLGASTVEDVGATDATSNVQNEAPPENNSTTESTASTTADGVGPNIQSAEGTVKAVVRLDPVSAPRTASAEQTASTLKSKALQSQDELVAFSESTDGITVIEQLWLANAVVVEVDTTEVDPNELLDVQNVRGVHENFQVELPDEPSDNASSSDGAVGTLADTATTTSDIDTTWGLSQVNATSVWEKYDTRGSGVKVAVLDTGVDADHPDIELYTNDSSDPTYPGGWAEFDDEGNIVDGSEPRDTQGHGTHTSGTVAGGNASGEYIGVAPNASLMHGLVLPGGTGSFAQIIGGMQWAVDENADVVSLSLGANDYVPAMIEPVRNANDAGTIVVAAAGNSGNGSAGTPGTVYESVTVGSTGGMFIDDRSYNYSKVDPTAISDFSSGTTVDTAADWGDDAPSEWPDTYVVPDVVAPGWAVKSSTPGGQYAKKPGTSMATPHTSGVIALMLAASNDTESPSDVKSALYDSAWKPENCDPSCERGQNDTRYGTGIVDAYTATTLLVNGTTTVSGTVEDTSGTAIPNGDVHVGWKYTPAGDTGEFETTIAGGNYTVSADAFGYAAGTSDVNVSDGESVSTTVVLNKSAEAKQLTSLPDGFQEGTSASVAFEGANVQEVAVDVSGDYNISQLTVEVGGMEVDAQNNRTYWGDGKNGEIPVTVTAPAETNGNFSLAVTFAGHNHSTTITTNTTRVYKEPVPVAVVANNEWPHNSNTTRVEQLTADLDDSLPIHYEPEVVYGLDNATKRVDQYDVFVVNNVTEDYDQINTFVDVTSEASTGVVWLGQAGAPANAISKYSDATGNPEVVGDRAGARRPMGLLMKPEAPDHPILDGVNASFEDKYIRLEDEQIYHQWLEGVDMETVGTAAYAEDGYFGATIAETGVGIAVDDIERTALLPTLGYGYYMGNPERNRGYDAPGHQILANTVEWANQDTAVSLQPTDQQTKGIGGGGDDPRDPAQPAFGQPDHVSPGENISVAFEAANVQELTVELDDEFSTVPKNALTLYVDGKETAFNETLSYDSQTFRSLSVTVDTDDSVTGEVSLDYTFLVGDSSKKTRTSTDTETITGSTGRTAVYDGPICVPEDVDDLQTAVDLAVDGETIIVKDGTYDPVNVYSAGKYNITLTSEEGATPTIQTSNERGSEYRRPAIQLSADGVTVSGFELNVSDNEWDNGITVYSGHMSDSEHIVHPTAPNSVASGFEDITIQDVHVEGGESGLSIGAISYAPDATVQNVTTNGSIKGINVGNAPGAVVEDVRVTNSSIAGITLSRTTDVTVRDNHISDSSDGVRIGGNAWGSTVENNTVVNTDTGIAGELFSERNRITNNDILNATVGLHLDGYQQTDNKATNYRVTMNDVDADTGVQVTHPAAGDNANASSLVVQFNDLVDTDVAVNNELETVLDARLNYYGENGPATQTFDGKVVSEPFLAVSPDEAAANTNRLSETPNWGVDLELEAGQPHTVGVPGPASGTIGEMFGDFEGVIYGYDESSQSWTQLTAEDEVSSLDAMLVIPKTDARLVLTFAQPGDAPDAPDQHALSEGWNFVSAPEAANVSQAFGYASERVSVVSNHYGAPAVDVGPQSEIDGTHQMGRDDSTKTVSPFTGYFVFSEGDGYMPAYLGENRPMSQLYEELGIERPQMGNVSMDAEVDSSVRHAVNYAVEKQVRRTPDDLQPAVRTAAEKAAWKAVSNTTGLSTSMRVKAIDIAAEQAALDVLEEAASTDEDDTNSVRIASHPNAQVAL